MPLIGSPVEGTVGPVALHRLRRWWILVTVLGLVGPLLSACGAPGAGGEAKPATLRVGLIPNQSPDRVKAQYEPFRIYLVDKLKMPVELFVATDYNGVVEAMINNKLDVAYFGGVTYVQAKSRADVYPIVTEIDRITKTTKYHSVIITKADSPIRSLADLRDKRFAFGDINSTSGSLYPRLMLDAAGFTFSDDPKVAPAGIAQVTYSGGHDATALAVQNGAVDAGGLEERILLRAQEAGTVDASKIRILQRSEPIEGYPWVVRGKLDKGLVEQITAAFLEIKDPELLRLLRAEGYAKVTDREYEYVRQQSKRFGLLPK